jgi:hypothetical protein
VTSTKLRLVGRIRVPVPPGEAFRLFTPRGERAWAHEWDPRFPIPVTDDAEPGTVFETTAHGRRTIWLVTDRQPAKKISYARVTPDDRAGTVTVAIHAAGEQSEAEVTYDLTALSPAAELDLQRFADGYAAYLLSWQDAIASCLSDRARSA